MINPCALHVSTRGFPGWFLATFLMINLSRLFELIRNRHEAVAQAQPLCGCEGWQPQAKPVHPAPPAAQPGSRPSARARRRSARPDARCHRRAPCQSPAVALTYASSPSSPMRQRSNYLARTIRPSRPAWAPQSKPRGLPRGTAATSSSASRRPTPQRPRVLPQGVIRLKFLSVESNCSPRYRPGDAIPACRRRLNARTRRCACNRSSCR